MLTSAVFLDMTKVLDSVNYETLILKFHDVGASRPVIQWFCSYLNERRHLVRIHSTLSEPLPINCGVPQGSILGALSFITLVRESKTVLVSGFQAVDSGFPGKGFKSLSVELGF